jgi:hypothetical protein
MSALGWLLLLLIPFILFFFIRNGAPHIYAIRRVADIFLKSSATSPDTAITQQALGFKQQKYTGNPYMHMLFGNWGMGEEESRRDALQYLIKHKIVLSTPEKCLYLSETKLKASGLYRSRFRDSMP